MNLDSMTKAALLTKGVSITKIGKGYLLKIPYSVFNNFGNNFHQVRKEEEGELNGD